MRESAKNVEMTQVKVSSKLEKSQDTHHIAPPEVEEDEIVEVSSPR